MEHVTGVLPPEPKMRGLTLELLFFRGEPVDGQGSGQGIRFGWKGDAEQAAEDERVELLLFLFRCGEPTEGKGWLYVACAQPVVASDQDQVRTRSLFQ